MKRKVRNIGLYLKSKKGVSEVLQVILIIGLVALVAVKTLPDIAKTLGTRAQATNTRLEDLDTIYDEPTPAP